MVHNERMIKMKDNTTQQQVTISRTVKKPSQTLRLTKSFRTQKALLEFFVPA